MDGQLIAPEAHDRQKLIGGSDIAAVLGISPWRTPADLWRDKTTPRSEQPQQQVSIPKRRGIALEPLVGELLVEALRAEGHTVHVVAKGARYRDAQHPMFASEIDLELMVDGATVNAELKTASAFASREWGPSGGDDLPLHYLAQVQWGLGITGRPRAVVGALVGDSFRRYDVAADAETIAALRQRALAFWEDHVLAGVPPAPRNANDLALLFPTEAEAPPLLAGADLTAKVLRLRACKDEITAREAEADALEYDLKQAMQACGELVLPNGRSAIEWKTRELSVLNQQGLKEAHPALVRQFTEKRPTRVFRLKSFDTKGL